MKRSSLFLLLAFSLSNAISQSYRFKSVNLQGMGYVTGIISNQNSGTIYARTDVGGVYRWDSSNNQWMPLIDGKVEKGGIESFAIDPNHPDHLYIVGGNQQPGSLYQSTNRGETWVELKNFAAKNINVEANGPWRGSGERLAVDPNNGGKIMYFGSRNLGLWKSSDSGVNWSQVASSSIPAGSEGGVIFVAFDPSSGDASTNSQKIYVGVQGMGVYASTDGGSKWTLLQGGPAKNYFPNRVAISANGTAYITYSSGDIGGASGFVYKYSGTGNLTNVTPANKASEGFYGIAVDPANPNNVATFQWNPESQKAIHYSTNGGTSWMAKGFTRPANRTEPAWYPTWAGWTYAAAMMMDPANPQKVWLTTGFAVYCTDDISAASPKWNTKMKNFEELCVNLVKCPPIDGGADLITGFQDQYGFRVAYKTEVPSSIFVPNSFGIITGLDYCLADPNFIVAVGGDEKGGADGESKTVKYIYSIDNGKTWKEFETPTSSSVNGGIAVSCTDKKRWVIAPKDRMGTFNEPHYTTDGGQNWTEASGTPRDVENGCTEQFGASEFLISDKVNGMTFYYYCDRTATTWNGTFYRSTDGGATFTEMYSALPSSWRSQIAATPGKEGHVFYCSKAGSALYFTNDGGSTWKTISGVTKCSSIGFGKAIAPSSYPTIFIHASIAGKKSVYQSTDYCKTWTDINDGTLPTNISYLTGDMRTAGIVYVATGGRGILYGTSPDYTSLGILNENTEMNFPFLVYPNPAQDVLTINFRHELINDEAIVALYNESGTQVFSKQISKIGSYQLETGTYAKGLYLLRISKGEKSYSSKVLIK